MQDNKAKATWTLVHSITVNDLRRSIYFSDGGAVKITRHGGDGERQVLMFPAVALEDLKAISTEFDTLIQGFQSIKAEVDAHKATKRAEASLQRKMDQELLRQIKAQRAAEEALERAKSNLLQLQKRNVG